MSRSSRLFRKNEVPTYKGSGKERGKGSPLVFKFNSLACSFCSIGCVLALKFCGEPRMHEISKTQILFLEIPPRNDLIRLVVNF